MSTLDHLEILKEVVSIRRGVHPGWKGDRIYNGEFFLNMIGKDYGTDALELVQDIRNNSTDYSDLLDVSPEMVLHYANLVEKGVSSIIGTDAISAYYGSRVTSQYHSSLSR